EGQHRPDSGDQTGVVRRSWFDVRRSRFVVRGSSFVVLRTSNVERRTSYGERRTSNHEGPECQRNECNPQPSREREQREDRGAEEAIAQRAFEAALDLTARGFDERRVLD